MESTNLVRRAALVRPKHDYVGGCIGELLGSHARGVLEELHVGTTAFQARCNVSVC